MWAAAPPRRRATSCWQWCVRRPDWQRAATLGARLAMMGARPLAAARAMGAMALFSLVLALLQPLPLGLSADAAAGRTTASCTYRNREGIAQPGELLYNGMCIPTGAGHWPPPHWERGPATPEPTYLTDCAAPLGPGGRQSGVNCRPAAINITIGRQLFVDDFVVDMKRTNATRTFHSASMAADDASGVNPVIEPTLPWEDSGLYNPAWGNTTSVLPFPGGVWYVADAEPAKRYQLYYYVPSGPTAVAYSADGITWNKTDTGGPSGLNTIATPTRLSASSTVWYNPAESNPEKRFSMGFQPVQLCNLYPAERNPEFGDCSGSCDLPCATATLHSRDGVSWKVYSNASGSEGDASSFFYDAFRKKYVMSIKSSFYGRSRDYAEGDSLEEAAENSRLSQSPPLRVPWASTDMYDRPTNPQRFGGNRSHAEVYELMAVAYESVTVLLISIFQGKAVTADGGCCDVDEYDNIALGFSRDGGFHFTRTPPPLPVAGAGAQAGPEAAQQQPQSAGGSSAAPAQQQQRYRTPFIEQSCPYWTTETARTQPGCADPKRWNFVNVQPTGGGFLTFTDELRFYVSGRRANMKSPGRIAAGIARLRRDGFASFSTPEAPAGTGSDSEVSVVTTHPVVFTGEQLWVNVIIPAGGALWAELLVADGADAAMHYNVLEPWSARNCEALLGPIDATKVQLAWANSTLGLDIVRPGKEEEEMTLRGLSGKAVRFRFVLKGGARLFSFWVSSQHPAGCNGTSGGPVAAGSEDYGSQWDDGC